MGCVSKEKISNKDTHETNTAICSNLLTVNCDKNFTNTFSFLQQLSCSARSDLQCAISNELQQLLISSQFSDNVKMPVFCSLFWQ